MLQLAVQKLEPLLNEIAVLGGCATGLLVTDPAAPPVRGTTDIDVIIEIASYAAYTQLETRLRALGFQECPEENVICRWCIDGLVVDVMPTDTTILGFGNRWYHRIRLRDGPRLCIGAGTVIYYVLRLPGNFRI